MPISSQRKGKVSQGATGTPFEREYARLNAEQRCAVDAIEGPLMVIAGPGTGKTQVVSLRVANILRKTQMRPGNILCLTFSLSGAAAMRERLSDLMGADAYGVTVDTIHGFCNEIIRAFPTAFGEWEFLEHVSDIERYRMVNGIIDVLLPNCMLVNPKNPYSRTGEILSRISQVKREGKTFEDLTRVAVEYAATLAAQSKEGTKAHERDLLTARKFRDFVEIFRRYEEALRESQRYDYDDMILSVIAALRREEWLLQTLQERYQYVLVDEVQDTNGAQWAFLMLLTTYAALPHEPNICIVGDDDQAIYRFQGANLQNILAFRERFPAAPIVVLTLSYRCSQPILDAAGSLIVKNTERLVGRVEGVKKNLIAADARGYKRGAMMRKNFSQCDTAAPVLLRTPSDAAEPWVIADCVEERIAGGMPLSGIAILTQTNAELRVYAEVLRARNIPFRMAGKLDLLAQPPVRQLLAILRAAQKPLDRNIASALACACFGCHPADLGRLFAARREKECSLQNLLLECDRGEWALQLADRASVLRARDVLLDLHHKLSSRTVVETVERAIKESGLLHTKTDKQRVTGQRATEIDVVDFSALQSFFDYIKSRAYESPRYSLDVLCADCDLYADPAYGELRLTYEAPHLTGEGVALMTAHQSKGLEFDVVILTNFREGHWDRRRHPPSISIPEDLLFGWKREQRAFEQSQDERRLCYVAMTRAREELILICGSEQTVGEKLRAVTPSGFAAEMGSLAEERRSPREPERTSLLLMAPVRHIDEEFRAFLRERLKRFALSVTALNHFLEDPQMFLELDLLQMPQSKEPSLVYGNAVHAALRAWGLSMKLSLSAPVRRSLGEGGGEDRGEAQGEGVFGQDAFVSAFRRYLSEREVLTEKERAALLALGEEALKRYYAARLAGSPPCVWGVEKGITTYLPFLSGGASFAPFELRTAKEGKGEGIGKTEIPLKGLLDRIDLEHPDSSRARVIDYKTGRPQTEKQIRDGNYFRQLVFYALLLEHARIPLTPTAFVLDFIGERGEHPIERVFQITEQEKADLRAVIRAVWQKIQALDFTKI